ncbi:MAG: MFS transporter, partial [Syntrophomonadaceae bacterium]|nr:MFS transporter [Syntrophomonadaceae bacterium]
LFFIPTILLGAVQGLNIPTLQTILAEQAPLEYRAVFMSLNGSILRLGQTLGPVVVGAVFAFGGYNGAFWAGTAAALIGILVIKFMLPGSE